MRRLLAIVAQFRRPIDNERLASLARPPDPNDYRLSELDGTGPNPADIALAQTAADASWHVWPASVLGESRHPLPAGAPDLRGVWECYDGRMRGHVERVEQSGDRITITTGGLVHDMFCDGTLDRGVDDVAGIGGRRIRVAADYRNGVHALRPFGKRVVAVTRRRDGDEMIWRYGLSKNRLRRLTEPPLDHAATAAAIEAAAKVPKAAKAAKAAGAADQTSGEQHG